MPINLILIVLAQIFIWGLIRMVANPTSIDPTQWVIIAIMGTFLGISMDTVLGTFGIFTYLANGVSETPVRPQNLSINLLVFNAFASYGVAFATTALVADSVVSTNTKKKSKSWVWITCLANFIGIAGIILTERASFGMMVSLGIVIISFGEILLILKNQFGPLIALFSQESYLPFLKLWAFSISVGAGYEIANWIFPFWIWLPNSSIPTFWLRILIIFLGYFVLFHAMTTLWALFSSEK